ncbi:hypothetical protein EON83_20230 [bacterium]|nr:MAG: hypothetical protein EON83_20230 [bacterium]
MNLIEILRSRIGSLPTGPHTIGVESVLLHVEVATRHYDRGRSNQDETAFTDAIYRTNQAYEGSLKEAYRVLAEKNPDRKTPNDIEDYLQKNQILRPRVLSQLTTYRTEWRNPSTHDYKLDFNEAESLLAIFSVSAFAIVLIDQIGQKLAFEQVKAATKPTPKLPTLQSLVEEFIGLLPQFLSVFNSVIVFDSASEPGSGIVIILQAIGSLHGFLSAARPDWNVAIESKIKGKQQADLIISHADESLIVEIKRGNLKRAELLDHSVNQATQIMKDSGIKNAVIFNILIPNTGNIERLKSTRVDGIGDIVVVSTLS